ncbi:carbohydrate sulfotransferase 1-like isoform X2 [Physella acuta]|uniref:carbohydrate sulfotransferase 1-like isoform X2 n=1 Tax=Physella acuta TaxID=109671 RepID=UPI0027DBF98F|nr:carbohydrate sulfotransferase 1-like isoform X2 [Physella acuta]
MPEWSSACTFWCRKLCADVHVKFQKKKILTFSVILGTLLFVSVGTLWFNNSSGLTYKIIYIENTSSPHPMTSSPTPSGSTVSVGPPKLQVLLMTYGRSGSSFTSALISHHPDVFFTFEPLYVVMRQIEAEQRKPFVNDKELESRAIINAFLNCKFQLEDIYALDNAQHKNSDATKDFYVCLRAKKDGVLHLACFLHFLKTCQNHKTTFVKTIRFRAKWAEWFLENSPNFKLLFLVRDPRATLYSQSQVFRDFDWKTEVHNVSTGHCKVLEEDLSQAERLSALYPGRVKAIRYEEGAMDPYNYTRRIYEFLGLDLNEAVLDYIRNITNSTADVKQTQKAYSIVKNNSTLAMNRWRYGAGFASVKVTDRNCGHLYSKLGYKFVRSQRDLESDRSLVDRPEPGGLFD